MKTIASFFAVAALLAAPAAQANNILIYKVVQTSNDLYTDVTNPNTAPKGYAAKTYVSTDTYYMVMDLTTGTTVPNSSGNIVEIGVSSYSTAYAAYDSAGKSIAVGSKKLIFIQPTSPLSDFFGPLQPLKLANNYLWSVQSGSNSKSAYDYDDSGSKESFDTYFASRHLKGVGTPLVVNTHLTIPNVPRSFAGKAVAADWYQVGVSDGPGYPPYDEFSSNVVTKTWTLDTVLTTGANTVSINRTADLGTVTSLAAGTVENGIQRVHNLVYAQGFRVAAD